MKVQAPFIVAIEVNAEGRLMSAPKQTLSHLPLALVPSEAMQKRAEKYQFLFPFQEAALLALTPSKLQLDLQISGVLMSAKVYNYHKSVLNTNQIRETKQRNPRARVFR